MRDLFSTVSYVFKFQFSVTNQTLAVRFYLSCSFLFVFFFHINTLANTGRQMPFIKVFNPPQMLMFRILHMFLKGRLCGPFEWFFYPLICSQFSSLSYTFCYVFTITFTFWYVIISYPIVTHTVKNTITLVKTKCLYI